MTVVETFCDERDTLEGEVDLPRWCETFFATIQRIERGSIGFTLPDGRCFVSRGEGDGPDGRFHVANEDLFSRIARDGDMGFMEGYLDGWWTTPDLQALMDVILMNNDQLTASFPGAMLVRAYERLRHRLRANTRRGSRRNIAHHYDLGNDFYALWLDETMTYSSALYSGQGETLEQGQANKYAAICDRIGVKPGDRLLEIGCGWGGFAEYAIAERGAHVTGLTLSREQHDYAQKRLFEAGLADKADIVIRDYRDERGAYDGIASIEMLEAVGERFWPTYFQTVRARLKPGRVAAVQVITVADKLFASYRRSTDFIQKYIFPGGMLPSPSVLGDQAGRAGLDVTGRLEFGESYSETLREWLATFRTRSDAVAAMGFDDRFCRMWEMYLATCAACFRAGTTDVVQIGLRRPAA